MASTTLLQSARLFDSLAAQPRSNMSIVVTGDCFTTVEPGPVPIPAKAVTSVAAQYLRQQDYIGSIAPGRYADFLVIDGDPLRDVRELRKLTAVYRGGVAHDSQAILANVPKSDFVPLS